MLQTLFKLQTTKHEENREMVSYCRLKKLKSRHRR